ncbi:MAG: BatA domain-containing protein, partial [Planctomycetia bacterium]|nr:BatA domain-containing protein [Planctomycetia bacterium]
MHAILIAGAALVGLPILLHLIMKQEPKRLSFPAFRFLKQKLKTNQRKLRLRHFILLALRMLLILLFCLALYQPTFKSDQFRIHGEQPLAVVIVIDTSPSMGYMANNKTRLAEANERALEFLKELPEKSSVAVLDTSDPNSAHWQDITEARKRIEELKEPRGGNQPISSAVAVAYQLLRTVEQETEAPEPLTKLVVVLTDRTAASWDAGRTEDLKKLQDTVPEPRPVHVVFDLGVDQPANVAILSADMKPQVIPANQPANITVTVSAVGSDRSVDVTLLGQVLGAKKAEPKTISVPPGNTRAVTFDLRQPEEGLYQVEFSLAADDKLMFDNKRFLTFKVGLARKILTITDDPDSAAFWQAAHVAVKNPEFTCLVATPHELKIEGAQTLVQIPKDRSKVEDKPELLTHDLREFEVVCLLKVKKPNEQLAGATLWDKLRPYLQTGGKLIVMPGDRGWLDDADYGAANDLMPAKFKQLLLTKKLNPPQQTAPGWENPRDGKESGVTWVLDEKALKHPMLKPIDEWRQQKSERVDVLFNPRLTKQFWEVEKDKDASVVAYYRTAEKLEDCHPAVLERVVLDPKDNNKPKGKVLMLTTRMDVMTDEDQRKWHDYWNLDDSSWFAAFPYLLVRYLAGDTADANFNYNTGATVTVPLPRGRIGRESVVALDGPKTISGDDAIIRPGEKQTEIRVGPPKTNAAGNFLLSVTKDGAKIWKDGFSANELPEESNLEKVPVELIEELVEKDRVIPVDRNVSLRELLDVKLGGPIDLFPWLLIAVLMLLVLEGLVANRF